MKSLDLFQKHKKPSANAGQASELRNDYYYYLKCLLGLKKTILQGFLRHDTAYALF